MSFQISTALVAQFSSTVMHLAQQQVSRLSGTVAEESITGEKAFFDQVGAVQLILKTARHQDTPHTEIPHSRRMVVVRDYLGNEYIDQEDKVKTLGEFTNDYTQAFAKGIGRLKDDVIIIAATADAYTGASGATTESFDTTNNRVAVNYVEQGSAANSNLTVAKVRRVAELMNYNEVEESDRYAVISSSQLHSLQRDDEFTSFDFNVMKPLASGGMPAVDWMGFSWRRSERLLYSSGSGLTGTRRCLFYHKNGIKIGMNRGPVFRIAEAGWKNFATQVHAAVSWGASRMEQARVYEILCDQSA